MIYIQTALMCEATAIIKKYGLKKDSSIRAFNTYGNSDVLLCVSGIGRLNAASCISHIMNNKNITDAMNIGICGTGNDIYSIGDLILVNKIIDMEYKKDYYPDMLIKTDLPEDALITCNEPVRGENNRQTNGCFDMEASGFYHGASKFMSPDRIHILKIISDKLEGEKISPGFVNGIIKKNICRINEYIEKVKERSTFAREISFNTEIIDKLVEDLRLTKTQYYSLKEYSMYYSIKNGNLDILKDYMDKTFNGRSERNMILEEIKNVLTE